MNIPVVDLSDFTRGDPSRKENFITLLGSSFENVGFVALKNHGISAHLIRDMYKYVQQFFALPTVIKNSYEK